MGNALFETEEHMRVLARQIDRLNVEELGERKGFVLLVFGFGVPGLSNYISNSSRPDVVRALRDLADRLEAYQDIPAVTSKSIN